MSALSKYSRFCFAHLQRRRFDSSNITCTVTSVVWKTGRWDVFSYLENKIKWSNCLCRYYLRISVKIVLFETKFSHARSSCAFWSLSALCPFFGKLFTWELDYGVAMHLNLARGNTAFHWKKIMGPPECNRSRDWKIVHQIYLWKTVTAKLNWYEDVRKGSFL